MKILMAVHDFLPEHVGGTEIHAAQLARELARRGHELRVLTTERTQSRPEGDTRQYAHWGVPVTEIAHLREYADARDSFLEPLTAEVLRSELRAWRPALVHFQHLAFFGARALEVAREESVPALLTLHDYHLLCERSTLLRGDGTICSAGAQRWSGPEEACGDCMARHPLPPARSGRALAAARADAASAQAATPAAARAPIDRALAFERRELHARALSGLAKVICPSRFLADRFQAAGLLRAEQVVVMKAGYPGPRREARASEPAQPLRVGYVGGIYPSKGVHVLVEALAQLADEPIEASVHGVLEWFPDYVVQLRRAAAGARVRFAGRFDPLQLDAVLSELDLLVVPSLWYENMPLTIQEAWRVGLPVIASDLGGMAEVVQAGRGGLLFPPGDARALAELLRGLARDRARLLALARARPAAPTLESIADEIEALYRDIMRAR